MSEVFTGAKSDDEQSLRRAAWRVVRASEVMHATGEVTGVAEAIAALKATLMQKPRRKRGKWGLTPGRGRGGNGSVKQRAVDWYRTHPEARLYDDDVVARALKDAGIYAPTTYVRDINVTRIRLLAAEKEK